MSKIFKYNEFILNEEAVSIPQVITDFVEFLKESPVVDFYPEDEEGKIREGWITKEHKMYSMPGIIRYFKTKYGNDYSSLNVHNAIQYDPNIKKLTKMLSDNGMTLQITPMKAMYGETSWFYSVNLSDEERESIKSKYEAEFASRYSNYFAKRAASRKASVKPVVASKRGRKSTKGTVKEALELLIEGLFDMNSVESFGINEEKKWIQDAIKKPGSLRKSLKKKKGEKITQGEISSEISKLKKKDKDKEKPGLQLSGKDKTKYKRLTLARTLKSMK